MSEKAHLTRRCVLRVATAACAFPDIVRASVPGRAAPGNRVTLGCIGVGGRGTQNLRSFLGHRNCRVLAVCDVNRKRVDEARQIVNEHYDNSILLLKSETFPGSVF